MQPAHPLFSGTHATTETDPGEEAQSGKGASAAADHETRPKNDAPHRLRATFGECLLPRDADFGREARTEGGVFITDRGWRITIDVRRGHLDPDRRRRVDPIHRLAQDPSGLDA